MSGHEDEPTPIGDEAAWAAMKNQLTNLRDELRSAAQQSRERPEWTKRRMPTITGTRSRGAPVSDDFTVTNAEGVAAVHEARRNRKYQRDLGLCCRPGDLCPTCELEAEAKHADD